jgi:hypothetical protein
MPLSEAWLYIRSTVAREPRSDWASASPGWKARMSEATREAENAKRRYDIGNESGKRPVGAAAKLLLLARFSQPYLYLPFQGRWRKFYAKMSSMEAVPAALTM